MSMLAFSASGSSLTWYLRLHIYCAEWYCS